jgi:hypothetical protein
MQQAERRLRFHAGAAKDLRGEPGVRYAIRAVEGCSFCRVSTPGHGRVAATSASSPRSTANDPLTNKNACTAPSPMPRVAVRRSTTARYERVRVRDPCPTCTPGGWTTTRATGAPEGAPLARYCYLRELSWLTSTTKADLEIACARNTLGISHRRRKAPRAFGAVVEGWTASDGALCRPAGIALEVEPRDLVLHTSHAGNEPLDRGLRRAAVLLDLLVLGVGALPTARLTTS